MKAQKRRQRGKQRTVEIEPNRIVELVSTDGKKRKMVIPPGVVVRSKAKG